MLFRSTSLDRFAKRKLKKVYVKGRNKKVKFLMSKVYINYLFPDSLWARESFNTINETPTEEYYTVIAD